MLRSIAKYKLKNKYKLQLLCDKKVKDIIIYIYLLKFKKINYINKNIFIL